MTRASPAAGVSERHGSPRTAPVLLHTQASIRDRRCFAFDIGFARSLNPLGEHHDIHTLDPQPVEVSEHEARRLGERENGD